MLRTPRFMRMPMMAERTAPRIFNTAQTFPTIWPVRNWEQANPISQMAPHTIKK